MLQIRQNLVPYNMYGTKCPYSMTATRIVVHNTANDASASNEVSYMISNPYEVSFHYAVDDKEAVQGIPLDRNTWNAGDGAGKGNREGISIEICYSKSGGERFLKAEQNATMLIAQLLKERNWGLDKVTKHQDYKNATSSVGKYCPHRTLDLGWSRFKNMVAIELANLDLEGEITVAQYEELKASINKLDEKVENHYKWINGTLSKMRSATNAVTERVSKIENIKRYHQISDVPSYWKEDAEKLLEIGVIVGDGTTPLGGITESELKTAVIALRIGKHE